MYDLAIALTKNFTHTFVAMNEVNIYDEAIILAPRVAIYGNYVNISGLVNTTGMGC
jgi:hypothetical protein